MRWRVAVADDGGERDAGSERACDVTGQYRALIEAALAQATQMQRHRHHQRHRGVGNAWEQQRGEAPAEAPGASVLEAGDGVRDRVRFGGAIIAPRRHAAIRMGELVRHGSQRPGGRSGRPQAAHSGGPSSLMAARQAPQKSSRGSMNVSHEAQRSGQTRSAATRRIGYVLHCHATLRRIGASGVRDRTQGARLRATDDLAIAWRPACQSWTRPVGAPRCRLDTIARPPLHSTTRRFGGAERARHATICGRLTARVGFDVLVRVSVREAFVQAVSDWFAQASSDPDARGEDRQNDLPQALRSR